MSNLESLSKAELIEKLKQKSGHGPVTFKVATKGGISAYGLGQRFPTTLYASSWLALLDNADELRTFITEHKGELADDK